MPLIEPLLMITEDKRELLTPSSKQTKRQALAALKKVFGERARWNKKKAAPVEYQDYLLALCAS